MFNNQDNGNTAQPYFVAGEEKRRNFEAERDEYQNQNLKHATMTNASILQNLNGEEA